MRTERRVSSADPASPALYVNYFEVGHNPFEFLVDLGQYHPGPTDGQGGVAIHTRVAIAPPLAKLLAELLGRAVAEHESEHGPIAAVGPQSNPFEIVLSSLGDFEDRARALRARQASSAETTAGTGRDSTKRNRSSKGR